MQPLYNPQVPRPSDIPADNQDEFLSNFFLLNQYYGVDHVPFSPTVATNGYHKKTTLNSTIDSPNRSPPYSAYYSKNIANFAELFFQNGVGSAFEKQLTGIQITQNKGAFGFKTPWGITFNIGLVTVSVSTGNPATVDFVIPYSTQAYTVTFNPYKLGGNSALVVQNVTNSNFQIATGLSSGSANVAIFYMSVGK